MGIFLTQDTPSKSYDSIMYIQCSCHAPEHSFVLEKDKDGEEVYLSIYLAKQTFLRRLYYAILFVFGRQCKYGAFQEVVLSKESQEKIVEFLIREKDD